MAGVLKPRGKLVVSIPNIAHVSIIYDLLNTKWNYADAGLLDRTHLRFFTRETMVSMIEEAGFSIESCEYFKLILPENLTRLIDDITKLSDVSISREDLEAYQIFITAVKK